MIQQSSMPPVSANVLAALVGSLQLPPAPIVSAPGAAPMASSFPALPLGPAQSGQPLDSLRSLGTAQSGQAFTDMLVSQLASAITRAESHAPVAGGTAPPQAASPPLWAATAPPPPAGRGPASGLADAGESPGQQVVDQTGTPAGEARSLNPVVNLPVAPTPRQGQPQVAVSQSLPVSGEATRSSERNAGPSDSTRAASRGVAAPRVDPAAEKVRAVVATMARASSENPEAVEPLRATLLAALGSVSSEASPESARLVRHLSAAVIPAGHAGGKPTAAERSSMATVATAIRAASPAELTAIVRRAEANIAMPESAGPVETIQGLPGDAAADRVQSTVASFARADAQQPATLAALGRPEQSEGIEVLRTSLLNALTAVDPPRTPAAAQLVQDLARAMASVRADAVPGATPTEGQEAGPLATAASPVPSLAASIRSASPVELLAFVRQAATAMPAIADQEPMPASSPAIPQPETPTHAVAGRTASPAGPVVASSYASLMVGAAPAAPTPAAPPLSPVPMMGSIPLLTAGGAVAPVAPMGAGVAAVSAPAASGASPVPERADPGAAGPAPAYAMRAAVHAYDQLQPDAPYLPEPGVRVQPAPAGAAPAVEPAMPMPVSMPTLDPVAVPVVAEAGSAPVASGLRAQVAPTSPQLDLETSAGGFVNQDGTAIAAGSRASQPASPGAVTRPATASRSVAAGTGDDPVGRSPSQGEPTDGHVDERSGGAIPGLNGSAGLPGHVADTPAPAAPAPGHAAAVAAAVAQLAQESAQTAPGTVRNLELRLRTGELGLVRVKLAVDRAGGVRIEVRTASDQAAQALRSGLPQLADALAARQLALSGAAVQVMSGAEFGGSNQPRQQPRWFERARKPGLSSGDAGEPVLAGIGATSWGRGPAGVNVLA